MALAAAMWPIGRAEAAPSDELVQQVNAYRASPASCDGRRMPAVPALAPRNVLASIEIKTGTVLVAALEQVGYAAEQVEAISLSGPDDAASALSAAVQTYCHALRSTTFRDIGASRSGNTWQIVLAAPAPPRPPRPPPLSSQDASSRATLDAVNLARASGRYCGSTYYPAAPPVDGNAVLDATALQHSRDMVAQHYFSHTGKDGRTVSARAVANGYAWVWIAENIATGQRSVEEVVNSWLTSPGHCVNIMNPVFKEMGAAYALDPRSGRPYWTQVFGHPRR